MRNLLRNPHIQPSFRRSSKSTACFPFLLFARRNAVSPPQAEDEAERIGLTRESTGFSIGLNWALALKGVIVKGKAFPNLKPSELKQHGATIAESLSGFPFHVRGNVVGGASKISKALFGKLLKQVTNHISSIANIFVHDGAIGSSPNCDAKVRVISDNPSAILSLSNVLYKTHTRSVSHDSCPLTVYVATSIRNRALSMSLLVFIHHRKNSHLLARTKALLFQNHVPKQYWEEAVLTATHMINGLSTQVLCLKSPIQVLTGFFPNFSASNNLVP